MIFRISMLNKKFTMIKITAALLIFMLSACQSPIAKYEFYSGDVDRAFSPIYFDCDVKLNQESDYYLENLDDGERYPVQVISENELITIIDDFPAQSTKYLELKKGDIEKSVLPAVRIKNLSTGIEITIAEKPVLFYQSQTTGPNGNQPEYYNRSGFIHPVYSPNGEILTDGFPVGHTHQNAIFNAWTNTTFKGKKIDFWNRQEELGTIKHKETISNKEGKVYGQITTSLSHISREHGEILEEEWQLKIYPIDRYFLFDLQSTQVNTSQDTLFLNEYLYGGMAYRGSKEWNKDDTVNFSNSWKILTSEGYTNQTANHTKAAWVDASGMINGKRAGLAVFSFPENFRAPQMIRVHPEMPYWVYSPVVEGAFFIAPGQKYISRYRYLSHDGGVDAADLDRIQADLEHPVVVRQLK